MLNKRGQFGAKIITLVRYFRVGAF